VLLLGESRKFNKTSTESTDSFGVPDALRCVRRWPASFHAVYHDP
jgi:hypothetical protein